MNNDTLIQNITSMCDKNMEPTLLIDLQRKINNGDFNTSDSNLIINDIDINNNIFDQITEINPIIKAKNSIHYLSKIETSRLNINACWLELFEQITKDIDRHCTLLLNSSENNKLNKFFSLVYNFDITKFQTSIIPSNTRQIDNITQELKKISDKITRALLDKIKLKLSNIVPNDIYILSEEQKKNLDTDTLQTVNDIQDNYNIYKIQLSNINNTVPQLINIDSPSSEFVSVLNIINAFFDIYDISALDNNITTLDILKDILSKNFIIGNNNQIYNVIQKNNNDTPNYQIYNKIYYSLSLLYLFTQQTLADIQSKYDIPISDKIYSTIDPITARYNTNSNQYVIIDPTNRLLLTGNDSSLVFTKIKIHNLYNYYRYINVLNDTEIDKMGFMIYNDHMFDFIIYDTILNKYINYWKFLNPNRKAFAKFLINYVNKLNNIDLSISSADKYENIFKKLHIIRCLDNNDNFNGLRMIKDSRNMKQMNTSGYKTHKKLSNSDINIRDYILPQNEKLLIYYNDVKSIFANQKCFHLEKELFTEIYNFITTYRYKLPNNKNTNYIIIINNLLLKKSFNLNFFEEGDIVSVVKNNLTLYKYRDNSRKIIQLDPKFNLLFNLISRSKHNLFFVCKSESSLENDNPLTKNGLDVIPNITNKLFNTILTNPDDNIIYISGSSESSITTASFLASTQSIFNQSKIELCYYFNKLHIIYYLRSVLGLYKNKSIDIATLLNYFQELKNRISYSIDQDENDKKFIDYLMEKKYNLTELYKFPASLSRFLEELLKDPKYSLETYYDTRFDIAPTKERKDLFNFLNVIRCAKQPKYIMGLYSKVLDKTELSVRLLTPSVTSNANQSIQIFNYSTYDTTGENINKDNIATYNGLLKYYFDKGEKIVTCDKEENYDFNQMIVKMINYRYMEFKKRKYSHSLKCNFVFVLDVNTISRYLKINPDLIRKYQIIKIFGKNVYFKENDDFVEINDSILNDIFIKSLQRIFKILSNREYISIYLINASSIINPYHGAEIDIPLNPNELTLFRDIGVSLFNLEVFLNKFDTYYFTSYNSNYLLATTTIAMQNKNIEKIKQNIANLHLIKILEYISRNVSFGRFNFTYDPSITKEENYFNYFALSPEFVNNAKFKNIIDILDQIVFNIDTKILLKFIMRYDYLFLLRKYINMHGFLDNTYSNPMNNNNNNNNNRINNTPVKKSNRFTRIKSNIKRFTNKVRSKVRSKVRTVKKTPTLNPSRFSLFTRS